MVGHTHLNTSHTFGSAKTHSGRRHEHPIHNSGIQDQTFLFLVFLRRPISNKRAFSCILFARFLLSTEHSPYSGTSSLAQHHRDEGIQKENLEGSQRRGIAKARLHRSYQLPNLRLHLLFEKNLCGARFRAFVFERSITTAGQPIQRFKTACDVTFLALPSAHPLTQTGTRISRHVRRNQRWNLRDSVEERNPMLLLGRVAQHWPGWCSWIGRSSCQLPRPFPLGFQFRNKQVRSGRTLLLAIFKNKHCLGGTETEILSIDLLLCLS